MYTCYGHSTNESISFFLFFSFFLGGCGGGGHKNMQHGSQRQTIEVESKQTMWHVLILPNLEDIC